MCSRTNKFEMYFQQSSVINRTKNFFLYLLAINMSTEKHWHFIRWWFRIKVPKILCNQTLSQLFCSKSNWAKKDIKRRRKKNGFIKNAGMLRGRTWRVIYLSANICFKTDTFPCWVYFAGKIYKFSIIVTENQIICLQSNAHLQDKMKRMIEINRAEMRLDKICC